MYLLENEYTYIRKSRENKIWLLLLWIYYNSYFSCRQFTTYFTHLHCVFQTHRMATPLTSALHLTNAIFLHFMPYTMGGIPPPPMEQKCLENKRAWPVSGWTIFSEAKVPIAFCFTATAKSLEGGRGEESAL